jgi:hypothetical protein
MLIDPIPDDGKVYENAGQLSVRRSTRRRDSEKGDIRWLVVVVPFGVHT